MSEYKWLTHEGEELAPADMKTSHIFYSVRMIFNHTCPKRLRIPDCKEWSGVRLLGADYLRDSVKYLLLELSTRRDIAPWMVDQISRMASAVSTLKYDINPQVRRPSLGELLDEKNMAFEGVSDWADTKGDGH